jgi:hypothetical protein
LASLYGTGLGGVLDQNALFTPTIKIDCIHRRRNERTPKQQQQNKVQAALDRKFRGAASTPWCDHHVIGRYVHTNVFVSFVRVQKAAIVSPRAINVTTTRQVVVYVAKNNESNLTL